MLLAQQVSLLSQILLNQTLVPGTNNGSVKDMLQRLQMPLQPSHENAVKVSTEASEGEILPQIISHSQSAQINHPKVRQEESNRMPLLKMTNKAPKSELKMFHGVQLITLPKSNTQANVSLVKTNKTKLAWTKNKDLNKNKPKLSLLIGTKPMQVNKNEANQEMCPKLLHASVPSKQRETFGNPSLSTTVYKQNNFYLDVLQYIINTA